MAYERDYPRDMVGYGRKPVFADWPGKAKIAVQFVLNYEEGGVLYAEGEETPKMMSIGMHCRILGRPGRFGALRRFLDHIEKYDRVWVCRRIDIARHWHKCHVSKQQLTSL